MADESIEEFACRRTNDEIARILVDAFVTGIHAGDPGLLSIRAAFPRLSPVRAEHGSVTQGYRPLCKTPPLGKPRTARSRQRDAHVVVSRKGLALLVETLPPEPAPGRPVTGVRRSSACAKRRRAGGYSARDRTTGRPMRSCSPVRRISRRHCSRDMDPALADEIGGIAYNRIAVVAMGYRRQEVPHSLDGFGYLTPGATRRDVLGVQWCSSIFPGRAPEGWCCCGRCAAAGIGPKWSTGTKIDLARGVRTEFAVTLGVQADPACTSSSAGRARSRNITSATSIDYGASSSADPPRGAVSGWQ